MTIKGYKSKNKVKNGTSLAQNSPLQQITKLTYLS
jgi:hypothetical protein